MVDESATFPPPPSPLAPSSASKRLLLKLIPNLPAREVAKKILASHQPSALSVDVEKKIWSIVRDAEKRQA